ncbi:hypothetical protein COCON_G00054800 [Conger conger]|uniref:Uncharacterized protein n=1 Tax=Conger conger TaxID=82655 RepID=A0A9Q1I5X9_CONCO|nr:hypothetical protein COCON_G00054800 [Conger conger]
MSTWYPRSPYVPRMGPTWTRRLGKYTDNARGPQIRLITIHTSPLHTTGTFIPPRVFSGHGTAPPPSPPYLTAKLWRCRRVSARRWVISAAVPGAGCTDCTTKLRPRPECINASLLLTAGLPGRAHCAGGLKEGVIQRHQSNGHRRAPPGLGCRQQRPTVFMPFKLGTQRRNDINQPPDASHTDPTQTHGGAEANWHGPVAPAGRIGCERGTLAAHKGPADVRGEEDRGLAPRRGRMKGRGGDSWGVWGRGHVGKSARSLRR